MTIVIFIIDQIKDKSKILSKVLESNESMDVNLKRMCTMASNKETVEEKKAQLIQLSLKRLS